MSARATSRKPHGPASAPNRARATGAAGPSRRAGKRSVAPRHKPQAAASEPALLPHALELEGRRIELSNLTKVLYPETGFTKGQVIDYYLRIAPVILPHLEGRPLTLKRYPNGVDQMFFYEKRCPAHRPQWVATGKVWSEGNSEYINYCLVEDTATLAWLANLACLELHTLLSRLPEVETPTAMVFDLDPGPPADILDSACVSLMMRGELAKLGIESVVKTSGSKGLHLWAPLNTPASFERTKHFAHSMALTLEREHPKQIVSLMRKELRQGKVFIDWSQNDAHKTTACAYSLRARAQPTVSTPVTWEELRRAIGKRDPARLAFTTDQVLARIDKHGDVFAPVLKLKQRLPQ